MTEIATRPIRIKIKVAWLKLPLLSSSFLRPDIFHSFWLTSELIPIQIVFPLFCFASQIWNTFVLWEIWEFLFYQSSIVQQIWDFLVYLVVLFSNGDHIQVLLLCLWDHNMATWDEGFLFLPKWDHSWITKWPTVLQGIHSWSKFRKHVLLASREWLTEPGVKCRNAYFCIFSFRENKSLLVRGHVHPFSIVRSPCCRIPI